MAFIDDVFDKAQKATKFIGQKACDTKDYVALEYRALNIRNSINEKYKELGRHIYASNQTGNTDDQQTASILNDISSLFCELDSVKEQILKFKKTCPVCSAPVDTAAAFCKKCGTKL